ncbi:MAG TPA: septum formation protein Maf [Firmicutes bacterium]|nr:septum formation protein Maf [Bacillota bacterium]
MLILASASPRRKELLSQIGLSFTVHPARGKEILCPEWEPAQAAEQLAIQKAEEVAPFYPADTVIGADTLVAWNHVILGKPADAADARRMLEMLSGQRHHVYTGVCIIQGTKKKSFVESTQVTFYPYGKETIEWYLKTGEPFDKAGAYGIQGKGTVLVEKINGDYNTVVGLPVARLWRELTAFL